MTHPMAPLMTEIKERLSVDPGQVHEVNVRYVQERGLVVRVTVASPITFGSVETNAIAYPEFDLPGLDQ